MLGGILAKVDKFAWLTLSPQPVIGVDEVGRGCLAGPVYAAAVIIDPRQPHSHYTDSKLLSAKRRTELAAEVSARHRVGLGMASVEEIDRLNILQAALLAMKRAVEALGEPGGHILVDGNMPIPGLGGRKQTTLVKGDLRAEPVAAASIVAKVARDEEMQRLEAIYPGYGFRDHKGYGTADHRAAIAEHGPTPCHRRTFAGVREYWQASVLGGGSRPSM